MLASTAAYLATSLMMPRSILTEKLARRGYHLSREYGVDPLETVSVGDVMVEVSPQAVAELPKVFSYEDETCRAVAEEMATTGVLLMPVFDRESGRKTGSISAQELLAGRRRAVVRESERQIHFRLGGRREENPSAERTEAFERTLD